ncbi:hypothetical protein L1987_39805 [Smallanthus sonchifolius]|uniref:Uncharacterized protein n=1 Tax=Smallanthus sonchifolius TaxID=185202 RepID=A0ACB9HNW8_9ASTR|nr:hypothetical protein L1987_39805 [Smallanthus sonchifolius]
MVQEEDGFTIVNRKGKKKAIKLQKKKKQVVVRTNSIGQKPNQMSPTMSDELHNHSVGTAGSIKSSLGFDFTRAVQGANVKTKKPPNQSPSTSLQPAGAASGSVNRHPQSAAATMDVEPPQTSSSNRFAALSAASEQDDFDQSIGTGRTYGISDSQRKAIAERLSVSNSICSEETVNWCLGEWDYFNDLCISLGLDPDYCIEDVESDTENGTAQFFSDLMKSGRPKTNHWPLNGFVFCDIRTVWDMGQQKTIFCLLWSWLAKALKPMWVLFWHIRVNVMAQKDSPKCDIRFIREEAHVGVSLGKPMALCISLALADASISPSTFRFWPPLSGDLWALSYS